MLLTRRLWQSLQIPPKDHPLYGRTRRIMRVEPINLSLILWGTVVFLLAIFMMFRELFLLVIIGFPILVPPIVNLISGLVWTTRISGGIYNKRQQGLLELVSVSPEGAFGACWSISMAYLHGNHELNKITKTSFNILRLLIIYDALLIIALLFNQQPNEDLLLGFAGITTLVILNYIDIVQSSVLSVLTGITSAAFAHNSIDAKIWAIGGFLAVQVITYMLTAILGLALLPTTYRVLNFNIWGIVITLPFIVTLLFAGIREAIFAFLWRYLDDQLGTDQSFI